MQAILIDHDKIVTKDLQNKLSPAPKPPKGSDVGLVLLVNPSDIELIKKAPKGKERVKVLNSINIHQHYYVLYNKKKDVCIILGSCYPHIKTMLPALFAGFTPKTYLWVSVTLNDGEFMDETHSFVSNGFNNPYITDVTPLKQKTPPSIALVRYNTPTTKHNINITMNKILYSLKQHKNSSGSCSINARLSEQALSFLRKASKIGITVDGNGKKSQKELTGELSVTDIVKQGDKFVYVIGLEEGSVQSGDEEDVDVSATRYNFHSHPHEAYVRHSVDKAWPSLTDYLGYLQLGVNTIFHCVATLEGLYVMSFGPYWGRHLKKVSKSFIRSKYDIDHKEKYTPQEYASKVNAIRYKGKPIYNIQFFPWDQAGKVFTVSYSKFGLNCFATEKGVNAFRRLHVRG